MITVLALFLIADTVCRAQTNTNMEMIEDGVEYGLLANVHKTSARGESDVLYINSEFIKSLPVELRAIIARYSAHLAPYCLTDRASAELAQALGSFDTLQQAQDSLAEVWSKTWSGNEPKVESNFITALHLKRVGNALFFKYCVGNDWFINEFKMKSIPNTAIE